MYVEVIARKIIDIVLDTVYRMFAEFLLFQ